MNRLLRYTDLLVAFLTAVICFILADNLYQTGQPILFSIACLGFGYWVWEFLRQFRELIKLFRG